MSKKSRDELLEILKRILEHLENIEDRMRTIELLLKISQRSSLEKARSMLNSSKLRAQIYELCDGKHTVSEIARKLGKPMPLISRYLKDLESSGLIVSEQKGKSRYYYKVI